MLVMRSLPLLFILFQVSFSCIPTYNPDFGEELFTVPPNEPVTVATTVPPGEETTTVPQPTTTTITTTTTTTSPPCATGWTFNPANMFCYFYNMNELSWDDAEAFCAMATGGHLPSIANEAEYDFIFDYVSQEFGGLTSFWIGGTAPMPMMNQFTWIDGTPFTYTKWSSVNSQGMAQTYMNGAIQPTPTDGWRWAECFNEISSVCKAPAM